MAFLVVSVCNVDAILGLKCDTCCSLGDVLLFVDLELEMERLLDVEGSLLILVASMHDSEELFLVSIDDEGSSLVSSILDTFSF